MSGTFQSVGGPRASERRCSPRQRVLFASIQLGDDNGGLILDISERGMSVQTVAVLAQDELAHMRFQLSPSQPWVETQGRIAWIGRSLKTAGLEFVELPHEARDHIKQWISEEIQANEPVQQITLKKMEPSKDESENVVPFPESETMELVAENQNRHSTADGAGAGPPSVEKVFQYSRAKSTTSGFTGAGRGTTTPLLSWSELEAKLNREINARKRKTFFGTRGRLIGLSVGTGLLFLALFFLLGYHLGKSKYCRQQLEAMPSAKVPEPSTDTSASPTNVPVDTSASPVISTVDAPATPTIAPVDQTLPSGRPRFMLQVGAMAHKENADALAEALQQKNLPAGVSPPGTDRLYRVVVGPYTDADSALRAKEELKKEGFESIRTPVKPFPEQTPHSAGLR